MTEMRQQTLLWVIDPFGRLDWECDREYCTENAGGDHAATCIRKLTQDECDLLGLDGRDGTGEYFAPHEIDRLVAMGFELDRAYAIVNDPRYRF